MDTMTLPAPKAASAPEGADRRTVLWAGVRLALGVTQITGATAALTFLIRTGASRATVITVVITGGFTLASRLLFRGRPGSGRPQA